MLYRDGPISDILWLVRAAPHEIIVSLVSAFRSMRFFLHELRRQARFVGVEVKVLNLALAGYPLVELDTLEGLATGLFPTVVDTRLASSVGLGILF
jgi:hypothetical protein